MKIGTIINNHYAGYGNPSKYFIYTGIVGDLATGIYLDGHKLKQTRYTKNDFQNSGKFEKVGYSETFDIAKNDLEKFKIKEVE